ncbi:MAG: hypothetical protein D6734_02250 [Candidatus Schekmanbacteria bacterium]|nr:MAG: hypothetical protein D6734_02250 [Candidatus Schekmanbacteria bacterium]
MSKINMKKKKLKYFCISFIVIFFSIAVFVQGCNKLPQGEKDTSLQRKTEENLTEEKEITFFYPYRGGLSSKNKIIELESESSLEERIMKALSILFANNEDTDNYLPKDVKILDIFVDDDSIVYVNLDSEVFHNESLAATLEREFVSAVVLTVLKNFPEASAVKILVKNEERETLAGHIDISKPFYLAAGRNEEEEILF